MVCYDEQVKAKRAINIVVVRAIVVVAYPLKDPVRSAMETKISGDKQTTNNRTQAERPQMRLASGTRTEDAHSLVTVMAWQCACQMQICVAGAKNGCHPSREHWAFPDGAFDGSQQAGHVSLSVFAVIVILLSLLLCLSCSLPTVGNSCSGQFCHCFSLIFALLCCLNLTRRMRFILPHIETRKTSDKHALCCNSCMLGRAHALCFASVP